MNVGTLLLFLEPLNGRASNSHLSLGLSVNYFDESGLFIGSLVGGPLLVDALVLLVILLAHTMSLLIQAKRLSLSRKNEKSTKKTS